MHSTQVLGVVGGLSFLLSAFAEPVDITASAPTNPLPDVSPAVEPQCAPGFTVKGSGPNWWTCAAAAECLPAEGKVVAKGIGESAENRANFTYVCVYKLELPPVAIPNLPVTEARRRPIA